jgi:hypothetical protein
MNINKIKISKFDNGMFIGTNEWRKIRSYLTSKEISQSAALIEIRKNNIPHERSEHVDKFLIKNEDAWEYFSKNYPEIIEKRKINSFSELLYYSENYFDEQNSYPKSQEAKDNGEDDL